MGNVFSTIFLMLCGWMIHWLADVSKARALAAAQGKPPPSLASYWLADPYAFALSVFGLVGSYVLVPYVAKFWPELANIIGQTPEHAMSPMLALLGGYVSPSLADLMGKRFVGMVS